MKRYQRIVVFFGTLITALLVVLIVMMTSSGDSEPVAGGVSSSTEATATTAVTGGATGTEGTVRWGPADEPDPPIGPVEWGEPDTTDTSLLLLGPLLEEFEFAQVPVVVFEGGITLLLGDHSATGTPLVASLASGGFSVSHSYWRVDSAALDPYVCRNSSGSAWNTISLELLRDMIGEYFCTDIGDGLIGVFRLYDVQLAPDLVQIWLRIWDFGP